MPMAGNHQISPQAAVFPFKIIVPVGQQQPEGPGRCRADLLRQRLRRLLIRKSVGVVDPRQEDAVPIPGQGGVFVGQHRHAGLLQVPLQLPHVPEGPLVVACDEVGGGDLRQGPAQGHGIAPGRLAVAVLKVPCQENVVGPVGPDLVEKRLVALTELGPMEVRQLHDDAAVEARRQPGRGEGEPLRLQRMVAPPDKCGGQGAENQKFQQPPGTAADRTRSGHDTLLSFKNMPA